MTTVALIVTTYQWPEALDLVLTSASEQVRMPDEIHIADDGSGPSTARLVEHWADKLASPVHHHWQEDRGFRPNPVRNEAIARSTCDLVITVDGDMILHPNFVYDHLLFARPRQFIQSRRVRLDQRLTAQSLQQKRSCFSAFTPGVRRRIQAIRGLRMARWLSRVENTFRHIRGANMSMWRDDFIAVNGFDEDFTGWGFEDHDLTARLYHLGCNRLYLRQAGLAYHLEHEDNSRDRKSLNQALFEDTLSRGKVRCANGLAENHALQDAQRADMI